VENLLKYKSYLITLVVFIVYLITMAPSVVQIDAGELAAVQSTAGIAHPTGYPLFTIIGYLFMSLPLPMSDIFAANLLAAIFNAAAIFVFTRWLELLMNNIGFPVVKKNDATDTRSKKKLKDNSEKKLIEKIPVKLQFLAITAGAFLLAFSKTFWFQSTSVEVYSLHLLLINLILYSLLRAYFLESSLKNWLFVAVSLALGFSNHMTTLLILPGVAVLFFHKEKISAHAFKTIGMMLALFFPLLGIIYSYLPIRAAMHPALNWGNPVDFERFFRHFLGKQYQVWLFSSVDSAKTQLEYFFNNFPSEFYFVGLFLIIPGVFLLFRFNKIIGWFALVTFWSTVLYSINYDIADIDSYFLLAYIICGLWGATGIIFYYGVFSKTKSAFTFTALLVVLISGIIFAGNFSDTNQSDEYIYEDYTRAILGSAEENGIIFSYQWDYFVSASYYFQQVEGFRKDVIVIDKELLRRSWYFDQLNNNYPGIFEGLEDEVSTFRRALVPFEREENYNPSLLEEYFRKIMTGLVKKRRDEHPYYIGPEIIDNEMRKGEFSLPPGTTLVPCGLLYKVVSDTSYVDAVVPEINIRWSDKTNRFTENIKQFVSRALINRAIYEQINGYNEKAKMYINIIKREFPGFNRIPQQLKDIW